MAELADAPDSKSGSLRGVWVRFPPSASARHATRCIGNNAGLADRIDERVWTSSRPEPSSRATSWTSRTGASIPSRPMPLPAFPRCSKPTASTRGGSDTTLRSTGLRRRSASSTPTASIMPLTFIAFNTDDPVGRFTAAARYLGEHGGHRAQQIRDLPMADIVDQMGGGRALWLAHPERIAIPPDQLPAGDAGGSPYRRRLRSGGCPGATRQPVETGPRESTGGTEGRRRSACVGVVIRRGRRRDATLRSDQPGSQLARSRPLLCRRHRRRRTFVRGLVGRHDGLPLLPAHDVPALRPGPLSSVLPPSSPRASSRHLQLHLDARCRCPCVLRGDLGAVVAATT